MFYIKETMLHKGKGPLISAFVFRWPYLPYVFEQRDLRNSVDPDEMPQNAASHQGLHCLLLIQQFLDTTSGSKLLEQIR